MSQEITVPMTHRLAGGTLRAGNKADLVDSVSLAAKRIAATLSILAEYCEEHDQSELSTSLYGLVMDAEDISAIVAAWHSASQAGRGNAEP